MVEELLDSAYQKRFRIITSIFNSENHQIHQKKLLQKLGVSLTTLSHTLELIHEDLVIFDCKNQISIQFDPIEKKYFLRKKLNFTLDLLLLYYLEDSLKFQLLRAMMTDSLLSVNSVSATWFVTPSTLRRELHSLQKLLLPWQINIKTTHKKISLIGKESAIRLFYTVLFLNSYGAYKWIFQMISYQEVTDLLQVVPDDVLEKTALEKNFFIHYYCAISIIRMNKQKYFEEEFFDLPLYQPYVNHQIKQTQSFGYQLQRHVPHLPKKEKHRTVQALLSNILAWTDFEETHFPARFFLLDATLQQTNFLKLIFEIQDCFRLVFNGDTPLFLHSFYSIHYRMVLYHSSLLEIINSWENHSVELITLEKEKLDLVFQHLEQFIFTNPAYKWLIPYKRFLYRHYALLINQHLLSINPIPVVNIGLYSKFSIAHLKKTLQAIFAQHIKMNFTEMGCKQPDIIISDIILSKEILASLNIDCKIVYVHVPLTKHDYHELRKNIIQITNEKRMSSH